MAARRKKAAVPPPRPAGERSAAAQAAWDQAAPRPYPYTRELTHAGRLCHVPERRGKFKVIAREMNPKTGATWWALIGPQTAGDPGQFTNVREINLLPVPRKPNVERDDFGYAIDPTEEA